MTTEYTPSNIENKWQQKWDEEEIFVAQINHSMPKFYCLEMYPYPSGKMHIGHVRNYSIGDAVARYRRANGFNVIYPMGFDSFGMPAENAAIDEGGHPREITNRNIASIKLPILRFRSFLFCLSIYLFLVISSIWQCIFLIYLQISKYFLENK